MAWYLRKSFSALLLGALVLGGAPGCTDKKSDGADQGIAGGGAKVVTTQSAARAAELAALSAQLDQVKGLDAAGFAAKYAVPFSNQLGYAPLTAKGLDRVKASALALAPGEEATLEANGFVLGSKQFPSFIYGYETIYAGDLPVFVSADSLLYAVHRSFGDILKGVEGMLLRPKLLQLLASMRAALAAGAAAALPAGARADVDRYLSVAASLLDGTFLAPVAGGDAKAAQELYEAAVAATGERRIQLFGAERDVDFSQYKPRAHYTGSVQLQTYFRAMMWLGRIDFRIVETQPDHSQVFRRSQLEGAYVLRALIDAPALESWKSIDGVIGSFVGEPDNMTLPQLDALLSDLKLPNAAALASVPDATIAQAITNGGYGAQRISSHIMVNGLGSGTMPLSSTFLLLGQRYVLDSHVFSNVVYDRAAGGDSKRMMPNPLDVAFAALRNDQAGQLLGPELERYRYAPDLASMRVLAEAHPAEFWEANLYNEWLSMLRALSPTASVANPLAVGLPRVAGTEKWGRRILNTQLASWAELRHDTILYAKQSYTAVEACEFPDAYVEPYPELYARLAAFAARAESILSTASLPPDPFLDELSAYFARLRGVAVVLEAMAKNQRSGSPHTAEQLAFMNKMTFRKGCGPLADFDGWYAKLFFDRRVSVQHSPTVADVHTQPADENGIPVGKVLHVGVNMPRLMVVTVDSCSGPRAYVGLASDYNELITSDYERLTDQQWPTRIKGAAPTPWMTPILP